MIEAGKGLGSLKFDEVGERMLAVIGAAERNKVITVQSPMLSLNVANQSQKFDSLFFKEYRIIGLCIFWIDSSTANEDPVVEFGYETDNNACGTMTSTITGGEKFVKGDYIKYDPLDLLPSEVLAEASATFDITWTPGVDFYIWQTGVHDLRAFEAAAAALTTGYVRNSIVVEIKTGGRW